MLNPGRPRFNDKTMDRNLVELVTAYQWNPYAPLYFAGLNLPPPEETGYTLHHYEYLYNNIPNALSANQFLQVFIPIHPGPDFYLTGIYQSYPVAANTFAIQLTDETGYQLFSGFLPSSIISTSRIQPTPFTPPHPLPEGSRLVVNIQALNVAQQAFQLNFLGFTRGRAY